MPGNFELISRLVIAAALGGVIGFERERLSWAAGLRTHMLVCVSSSLIMLVSAFGFEDIRSYPHVALDPSRVAAQVVSGIGFLGAGSILLRGEVIRGLTTAASLWAVAGVGLAVGGGLYVPALAATAIMLIILAGIKPLEQRFRSSRLPRGLVLRTDRGSLTLQALNGALGSGSARVEQFVVQRSQRDLEQDEITIVLSRVTPHQVALICRQLHALDGVREVREVATP